MDSKDNKRLPSYLPIYDKLHDDIVNGVYPEGSIFPSENVLAAKYGVSRNTLRQALAILHQDGLIHKQQGKGTVVIYNGDSPVKERYYNYVREDSLELITELKTDYNFGTPTHIAKRKLHLQDGEDVLASNNVYMSEDGPVGQIFLQIPVKILEQQNIDADSEKALSDFMDSGIYKLAYAAEMSVQLMEADEQVVPYLGVNEGTALLHMEQMLLNDVQEPVARIKYYLCLGKHQVMYKW